MNQLLVDSMPTLITQPGLTATSITSINLAWLVQKLAAKLSDTAK